MTRIVTIGAGQLGPIARDEPREDVVKRLVVLLEQAAERSCELLVFPELALTTFFPRWYTDDVSEFDHYYESEMPSPATQPLFDAARRLGVGFCLGYAELTPEGRRYNTYVLTDRSASIIAKFRKVHIPGHDEHEPERPFQHLERRYFEESHEGFPVWRAYGGIVGMALCNDRRWPETYRVMGLKGAELILIGYNTPLHYSPDPEQNALQSFHNHLVMQAGAYQNGAWVVGVAKGGIEEGVDSLSQSSIIAPSGQIVAQAISGDDELISVRCDLDRCAKYKHTLFDFDRYRRPEAYEVITARSAAAPPPGIDFHPVDPDEILVARDDLPVPDAAHPPTSSKEQP